MTTLVALASKDALVMGTDSLSTATKWLVDPSDILSYFDDKNDFKLKVDDQGKPLLDNFSVLTGQAQAIPYNQLSNVSKLFDLSPLPIGVMFTGITSIGNRTIGKLVSEFIEEDKAYQEEPSNYMVQMIGERLLQTLRQRYASTYTEPRAQPELELIIGGYDNLSYLPSVFRIDVRKNTIVEIFSSDFPFGVAFGGQMDCIQRIVFGTDTDNQIRLAERTRDLLLDYHQKISAAVAYAGVEFEVPPPDTWGSELNLFNRWGLNGLDADIAEFSEQNAIDCVDFFIEIMIRAQAVSSKLPTVGGEIKIAVIRKSGFHFVSRQEWRHRDHSIKIPGEKSDREKTPVSNC
ncbi:MAG: hypothetical protein OXE94_04035 [Aestuariivita sp.]|nr:hypothetical protein [Aestuariivita sp.]MCY4201689.1 hypothetical protein [Aestuariivita sp.]